MRFLVTAGNTRERIDRVRDWGNVFTGNTGYSIAKALAGIGEVDLLTSNRVHVGEIHANPNALDHPIHASPFTTHADLKEELEILLDRQKYDAIFMTAAVADYKPVRVFAVLERETDGADEKVERWTVRDVHAGKVKSNYTAIAILGEQTEKIIDLFRGAWGYSGLLVKFKLEVGITKEELLKIADASRRASQADYLVANTLDMVEGASAGAFLVGDFGHDWVPRNELPARMARLVQQRP